MMKAAPKRVEYSAAVEKMAAEQGAATVLISAQIEEEISQLDGEEAEMFLGRWALRKQVLIG